MTTEMERARPQEADPAQLTDENTVQGGYDIARGLRRRQAAARRLPPMPCGCHDPLDRRHLDDRCRWRHP